MRLGTMLVALGVGVGLGGAAPADDLGLVPQWSVTGTLQWTRHGSDVFGVGDRVVVLDAVTGTKRRSASGSKPGGQAELLPRPSTDGALLVFGWYVWDRKEAVIVCFDARTLQLRWQRRFPWGDGVIEIRPKVHAAFGEDGVYVQLTGREDEENLLKLRRDTGDVIWAQKLDRWITGVPPVWYQGRLLIRSAVDTRYPNGHGHYQAVDPSSGLPVWRIRLESMPAIGLDDVPFIVGDRAYLTTGIGGPVGRLYVVDLQRGQLVEDSIVKELRHPFALLDRVIYFAGQRPGALQVQPGPDRELWRATIKPSAITPSDVLLPSIASTGVVDEATNRVYLGDTRRGIWVLSMADGKLLGLIDTHAGYVDPNPFRGFSVTYGGARLERDGDRVLVGTQDGRLLGYRLKRP